MQTPPTCYPEAGGGFVFPFLSLPLWGSWLEAWEVTHPNRSSQDTLCKQLRLQPLLEQWVGACQSILITLSMSWGAGKETLGNGPHHRPGLAGDGLV